MSELVVRRAREEDLPAVEEVHRTSIVELCSAAYSPEQIQQWVTGRLPGRHAKLLAERRMFVCERAGVVVGFGVLDVESSRVFAVYVSPTAVLGGVGRCLLAAMEEHAREAGIVRLELHATLNAVRFYERAGYACEEAVKVRLSMGVELDAVRMSKVIATKLPPGPSNR